MPRIFHPDTETEIAAHYANGESVSELADAYDASPSTIRTVVIRNGGTLRPIGRPRSFALSREDEADILARWSREESIASIARAHNTGYNNVRQFLEVRGALVRDNSLVKRGFGTRPNHD